MVAPAPEQPYELAVTKGVVENGASEIEFGKTYFKQGCYRTNEDAVRFTYTWIYVPTLPPFSSPIALYTLRSLRFPRPFTFHTGSSYRRTR
jgi:hypothetical protein